MFGNSCTNLSFSIFESGTPKVDEKRVFECVVSTYKIVAQRSHDSFLLVFVLCGRKRQEKEESEASEILCTKRLRLNLFLPSTKLSLLQTNRIKFPVHPPISMRPTRDLF